MRDDTRQEIYTRQRGRCAHCGAMLDYSTFHLAHIIPQRKHWIRRYGKTIIHHADNLRATCPTDRCNNGVSIGNNAYAVEKKAQKIAKNESISIKPLA